MEDDSSSRTSTTCIEPACVMPEVRNQIRWEDDASVDAYLEYCWAQFENDLQSTSRSSLAVQEDAEADQRGHQQDQDDARHQQ